MAETPDFPHGFGTVHWLWCFRPWSLSELEFESNQTLARHAPHDQFLKRDIHNIIISSIQTVTNTLKCLVLWKTTIRHYYVFISPRGSKG